MTAVPSQVAHDAADAGAWQPPACDAVAEGALADGGLAADAGRAGPTPTIPPQLPRPVRDPGSRFQPAYGVPADIK